MTNGCNEQQEAKIAERNERVKKVYRYVTDVSRRIGDSTASCNSVSDLFATNIEVQRQKLRENCEKLIFLDPLNYGRKSLELLWRKVYYETVCAAKKHRETNNEFDGYLFTHIMSGIGHFHHLIIRIESEFRVKVNELDYMPLDIDEDKLQEEVTSNIDEIHFAKSALFSCLIYLGDLSRYQSEIFGTFDPSIGARYYLQATQIDLSSGMPYNQLGNLFLDKNYNLESVCCYIHCLSSVSPFAGAIGNLTKIFEKNNQFLETINDSETYTQTEYIQNTIANFLYLTEIWYLGKDISKVSGLCNKVTHNFKIAMDFSINPLPDINKNYSEYSQAIEEEQINPSFLNSNMIHNIVNICLFTNAKLVETDENKAFACKAFTLAFLSQLLQKLQNQLELLGLKSPGYKYTPRVHLKEIVEHKNTDENIKTEENIVNGNKNNDITNETSLKDDGSDIDKTKVNGDAKNKKILAKRRRRRRAMSSESSDGSDSDSDSSLDTDKSVSNGEVSDDDISDSTYNDESDNESKSSNCDSDSEDIPVNGNGEHLNNDTKDETINKQDSSIKSVADNNIDKVLECNKEKEFDPEGIQNFLMGYNCLPSLKLLQDWVLTEKDLIRSCGDSAESLFQCVVDLLNIFLYYFNYKGHNRFPFEDCKVLSYAKSAIKRLKLEYKTIPLPEDINLRGTNICKFDKDAAEWQLLVKYKPSIYEENIIRILNFIDFGYQIAKIVPRIRFNRSMKIFYLRKLLSSKTATKVNHKRNRECHNSEEQTENGECVIKRLGRLWLTNRVKELERTGHAPTPSLLALDTAALHQHLKRVKQLLRTRSFIFLVPTVVLQELDELKRDCSSARDAIRWLEIQLKTGSRFVRTQRPDQSRPLPLLKYPRKAPQQVHNFVQILEFCNHFIEDEKRNANGGGDTESAHKSSLLILLVGSVPGTSEYKEFSLTGAAESAGISIENIGDFYTKWRQNAQKSGKKR